MATVVGTASPPRTLAAAIAPAAFQGSARALRSLGLVAAFSLFIAVSAQASVLLPFTPVPLTGQTLAVLLTGAVLGSRLGAAAVIAYLLEGMAGLPVFAGGFNAWAPTRFPGIPYLIGPTAGYLVGFVVATWVVGWLAERGWDRSVGKAVFAMLIGQSCIYLLGLASLARFVPLDLLVLQGLWPFLPGDAVKIALAALALPGAWSLLGRRTAKP